MGGEDEDNEKLKAPADFKGPGSERGCTDILCSILLIACWGAMTFVGLCVMGYMENDMLKEGVPSRLTNGMDYQGKICGVDDYNITSTSENIKDLPKAYYLPSGAPVCVKKCPTLEDEYKGYYCKYDKQAAVNKKSDFAAMTAVASPYMATFECAPWVETVDAWGYCVPKAAIEALAAKAADKMNEEILKDCLTTTENTAFPVGSSADHPNKYIAPEDESKFWKDTDETTLGNNCTAQRKGVVVTADYMDPTSEDNFFTRAQADMLTAQWVIIICGCGVAMVSGFLYLRLLQIPGLLATVCWGLIAVIELLFLGLAYYAYNTSETWKNDGAHSQSEADLMLYVGYGFAGIGGIWAIIICCLRKRIMLAIGIVKEACKAVGAMPVITFYPVMQVISVVVFLLFWCTYVFYLASSGEVVVECVCPSSIGMTTPSFTGSTEEEQSSSCDNAGPGCFMYKSFTYDNDTKLVFLYMLFSWFWTSQFVIAAGQLVVAMSISTWYFTKDKKTIGNGTFFSTMKKAMWYHLGTAAFGSLIIAIIKTIRVIITYLQNKFKNSKNQAIKILLCAIQCYMWCLEKCMKFLNKNAYIQTAIFGYSFCKAARKAFFLILRNVLRISAVAIVSSFVLIIGKLFIMTATTLLAYMAMEKQLEGQVNYLWIPTLLVCFISYFTAEMFNEVFGMAISTILQCFVADEEMFEVAERFAEGDLAKMIGKTNAMAKKDATIHPEKDGEKYEEKETPELA
eukprot:CAMPEP_0118643798 /NCGR_PEP_ID=MMETSP0785-20121206/6584_1 /TAXON_ID=91992 /ORGANISM="Bolidomonas pacifica, Strain CCMP 1866" /LENGTH=738 /DNA_ID=CAMNT_0006535487 /DNA_START=75 /DNA_END=2291 /DNA_ORIENTATION=-